MHTQPKNIAELTLGLKHFTANCAQNAVTKIRQLNFDATQYYQYYCC